jgi:hypothetical protein
LKKVGEASFFILAQKLLIAVRRFIAALDGPIHWPALACRRIRAICFPENGEMNFALQGGDKSPHSKIA